MIHYLKRNELDVTKYDNCIENAINSRIYAFSWYLDCVADNWDALVLNDYEAVMPLPWRQKYFIKYIYPPAWTQQLGVFSKFKVNAQLVKEFINSIPRKFKKISIQFNSENNLSLFKTEKRTNYILPLNKSYEEIYVGFNKNRKRYLKKTLKKEYLIDTEIATDDFFDFYLNESKNYEIIENEITTIKTLLKKNKESVFIWGIRNDKKLMASLIWLKDDKRITYLLPVADKTAKEIGFPTLLVSEVIRQNSNSNLVFDFEGSMLKGVGEFYRSFGGKQEAYFKIHKHKF